MENNILILTASLFIGVVSGYLGSLLITKRMALVGDALGHVALPGVALAILYDFNVIGGALLSLAIGVVIIWMLEKGTRLPFEALIGVLFTTSLAVALLFIPHEELEEALIGDIDNLGKKEAVFIILLSSVVFIIVKTIFKKITLLTLSEDLAKAEGIKTNFYKFLYLVSIGIMVALGIKFAGALLVGALLIIPATASRMVSNSIKNYVWTSMIFGLLSVALGMLLANIFSLPTGPMMVVSASVFFLLALISKKMIE